jgi:RecA-family ATPase
MTTPLPFVPGKDGSLTPFWTLDLFDNRSEHSKLLSDGRAYWSNRLSTDGDTPSQEDIELWAEAYTEVRERAAKIQSQPDTGKKSNAVDITALPDDFDELSQAEQDAVWEKTANLPQGPLVPDAVQPAAGEHQSRFISFSEMMQQGLQIAWLIYGFIEGACTGMLFGPPGHGKSFVALDWALSIACGLPWFGRKVKQGLAVLFVGEGHHGYARRIDAWRRQHEVSADIIDKFLVVSRSRVPFDSDLVHVAQELRGIEMERGQQIAFIVIDTLARHTPSDSDENSQKDMGLFIDRIDALRKTFPGSSALIVHHSGHSETGRGRGSSVIGGAMDFSFCASSGSLSCEKMKDAPEPEEISFTLQSVNLDLTDEEGEPVTSCVPVFGKKALKNIGLTNAEQVAVDVLLKISASQLGVANKDHQWGSLVGDWRSGFNSTKRDSDPDLNKETLKSQFTRAETGLIKKGVVVADGHNRILTDSSHQQAIMDIKFTQNLLPQGAGAF